MISPIHFDPTNNIVVIHIKQVWKLAQILYLIKSPHIPTRGDCGQGCTRNKEQSRQKITKALKRLKYERFLYTGGNNVQSFGT